MRTLGVHCRRARYLAVLLAVGVHASLVQSASNLIDASLPQEGFCAFHVWQAIDLVDYPIGLLYGIIVESDFARSHWDPFFWNYTFTYWVFMIGGSVQWGLLTWALCWVLGRRVAERREPPGPQAGTGADCEPGRAMNGRGLPGTANGRE